MEAVRLGNAWGAIYFTENFTDALVARMALGKQKKKTETGCNAFQILNAMTLFNESDSQQVNSLLSLDIMLHFILCAVVTLSLHFIKIK